MSKKMRVVINPEQYDKKLRFIQAYCIRIEECKNCSYYNKRLGCGHPKHPLGSIFRVFGRKRVKKNKDKEN